MLGYVGPSRWTRPTCSTIKERGPLQRFVELGIQHPAGVLKGEHHPHASGKTARTRATAPGSVISSTRAPSSRMLNSGWREAPRAPLGGVHRRPLRRLLLLLQARRLHSRSLILGQRRWPTAWPGHPRRPRGSREWKRSPCRRREGKSVLLCSVLCCCEPSCSGTQLRRRTSIRLVR